MKIIDRAQSALAIIDIQAGLMPSIENAAQVIANTKRLIDAATLLDIPTLVTEQYPKGLGHTVDDLLHPETPVFCKTAFDACKEQDFSAAIKKKNIIVVAGCEAHVCVAQTVLSMIDLGIEVYLVNDAIGSRTMDSHSIAARRLINAGANLVTTEMVLFEWIADANDKRFKDILQLVK